MGRNPYLDDFLQFYSQAEAGNGLTRGLESDLARRTYVQTKLDQELTPAFLAGDLRLAILTGNAGDGKTAFIQTVEHQAAAAGASLARRAGIGTEFTLNGRRYLTLYDGSVDTDRHQNADMLAEVFSSLEGDEEPADGPCLIVAMNEGKLRDFLGASTRHRWLSRRLLDHLNAETPLPADVVVVNLNLRSVVDARQEPGDCLFDRILDRFVSEEFWQDCESCPAKLRCPVKFNVDSFRCFPPDGLSKQDREATEERNRAAETARVRLKSLFQILHFRKRLHITVRDLRSALAFALFGKRNCAEIERAIKDGTADFTNAYYYNALFDPLEKDRVIGFFREFDVGRSAAPQIDARLSFTRPRTLDFRRLFLGFGNGRVAHLGRTDTDEYDLARLFDARPRSPADRDQPALTSARGYVTAVRRKLFFEGYRTTSQTSDAAAGEPQQLWTELLPYDNLAAFIAFMHTGTDPANGLKFQLVEGISRSEGIHNGERGRENICIRTRQGQDAKVKAFFTYPATDFTCERPGPGLTAAYLEYLPSSIRLRYARTGVTLEVSLDLYEMLMRIRDGYVPTAGEMRAFFLNLLMFKKQLMASPARELLLTETDYQLFKLTPTPGNGVALTAV